MSKNRYRDVVGGITWCWKCSNLKEWAGKSRQQGFKARPRISVWNGMEDLTWAVKYLPLLINLIERWEVTSSPAFSLYVLCFSSILRSGVCISALMFAALCFALIAETLQGVWRPGKLISSAWVKVDWEHSKVQSMTFGLQHMLSHYALVCVQWCTIIWQRWVEKQVFSI